MSKCWKCKDSSCPDCLERKEKNKEVIAKAVKEAVVDVKKQFDSMIKRRRHFIPRSKFRTQGEFLKGNGLTKDSE